VSHWVPQLYRATSPLQQDMCIKNYLFLSSVASAYYNFENTKKKEW
jgi:hypothetical protein